MARLAVARLWFCSNSFNPRRTRLADLQRWEWVKGGDALAHPRLPGSEFHAIAPFLATRPGWDVAMLRCAAAPPGGPLGAEVVGAWLADVAAALRPGRFDALYLSLHGAAQAEGDRSVETTILRCLRMVARRLPIVATLDPRASISDEIALLLDGTTVVQAPGEGGAAAARMFSLLEAILAGQVRPVGAIARAPPPAGPLSAIPPLRHGGDGASGRKLLDASAFTGFPWNDTPWAIPTALAWADRDAGLAREAAARLASRFASGHAANLPVAPFPAEALVRLGAGGRRVLMLDPADAPEAGGVGDTTALLRALAGLSGFPGAMAFGVLADADAVALAHAAGVGASYEQSLGAGVAPVYGPPLHLRVRVARLLPQAAVLQSGRLSILLGERPTPATPALFRQAGIDLEAQRVVAVKGDAAARAAFGLLFPDIVTCACPGPASPDVLAPWPARPAGARRRPLPDPLCAGAAGHRPGRRSPQGMRLGGAAGS
ncbi:M81 family metallopeptidase [Rhodovastum atsumiense]|uniref:M81 family metallopeptidase n=1 Tax=Rhodovastum atsumiense TaxID=504468 RepID=A0A5M6IS63_9PROT|nr:M81 family metallopeptidase [Rhodovastum atsumiense]KAA5611143.1 M81 family metallopeptidase [Rhodovastum atsumiense]CAH2599216.1 M81 family metallopeptidase [Rhodovastum atsumiense]